MLLDIILVLRMDSNIIALMARRLGREERD